MSLRKLRRLRLWRPLLPHHPPFKPLTHQHLLSSTGSRLSLRGGGLLRRAWCCSGITCIYLKHDYILIFSEKKIRLVGQSIGPTVLHEAQSTAVMWRGCTIWLYDTSFFCVIIGVMRRRLFKALKYDKSNAETLRSDLLTNYLQPDVKLNRWMRNI